MIHPAAWNAARAIAIAVHGHPNIYRFEPYAAVIDTPNRTTYLVNARLGIECVYQGEPTNEAAAKARALDVLAKAGYRVGINWGRA